MMTVGARIIGDLASFILFYFKCNFSKCCVAQNNVDCIHSSLIMVAGRRWYLIQCTHAGREWSYKIV